MAKTIKELTQDLLQAPSACKEVKEAAGEKAGGGKVMHLCAAKCRPRGECRQKGVVIEPAGACRNGAKPPLRATALKARLLARRCPFFI